LKLDIDGWLRRIGFAQYAEMFRTNDINVELLGRLTNDDLKDIGIVSLGPSQKLLEAIADLGSAPATAPAAGPGRAGADPGDCCAATNLRPGRSRRRAPAPHG